MGAAGYVASVFLEMFNVGTILQNYIIGYFSSLIIATPFLLSMVVLHYTVPEEKRFWTNCALALAAIYATFCTLNYVLLLTTVLPAGYIWTPANPIGTLGPLTLLNQTPHSLFWDIDGLGYMFMGLACLFMFSVFENFGLQKWLRWFFLANALVTPLLAVVYFYPGYNSLTVLLGSPWGITAPGATLLLAFFFRRQLSNL